MIKTKTALLFMFTALMLGILIGSIGATLQLQPEKRTYTAKEVMGSN